MPARLELPIVDDAKPLDVALKRMRDAGVHTVVVSGERGSLRILNSRAILRARARGLRTLKQVRAKGWVVAKPALSRSETKRALRNEELWNGRTGASELFGHSRAHFVLTSTTGTRATIVSRNEEFAGLVSGGAACICTQCDHCVDSPPGQQGHTCPKCRQGRFDCY